MPLSLKVKTTLLGLLVLALGLVGQPTSAEAEIAGSLPLPAKAGVALVVYTTGGTPDELREELVPGGCELVSVWTTVSGRSLGYTVGAPAFVNTSFAGVYPGGAIPAGTPLIAVCREGGVGDSSPTPTPTDPSGEINLACGSEGNQATFSVVKSRYPERITDANSAAAVLVGYRFPEGAVDAYFHAVILTQFGAKTPEQIHDALGIEVDPGTGIVTISGGQGLMEFNPVVDGTLHYVELSGPVPNRPYFDAYAKGDLTYNRAPGLTYAQVAEAFGVADRYALGPVALEFGFTMPDGKTWQNSPLDQHSCDYVLQ